MENINLDKYLSKLFNKIYHQISGSEILENIPLNENAVEYKLIEKGLGRIKINNSVKKSISIDLNFPKEIILFVIPLSGQLNISSDIQNTQNNLDESNYGILAYPFQDWAITIDLNSNSSIGLIAVTVNKIHELFDLDIEDKISPREVAKNYRSKTFLSLRAKKPSFSIVSNELFEHNLKNNFSGIYEKAKVLEIMSMYLEQGNYSEHESNACPVIHDNLEEEKIRRVEKILISNMSNPPSIPELAKMVGTNEMKLKSNFKKIFRNTIYGYLVNHRMDSARLILDKGNVQIKDVAYSVGYANPSHFIAAFKKKFGVTPKKYLLKA
ncbi:MAG: AraC family transcriptional regulator [Cytophagales bacterium]